MGPGLDQHGEGEDGSVGVWPARLQVDAGAAGGGQGRQVEDALAVDLLSPWTTGPRDCRDRSRGGSGPASVPHAVGNPARHGGESTAKSVSRFRSKPRSFARVGPTRAVPDGDDDGGSPASSSLSGRVSSDGRRGTGGVVIDGLDQVIVESGPRIVPWPPRPGPIGVGIPSAVWHPHAARRRSALRNLP